MKQFFTVIAANLVTIAVVVVCSFLLLIGIVATAGGSKTPTVRSGSVLVIDLDHDLIDAPANAESSSPLQDAFNPGGQSAVPLRSAIMAIRGASSDDRVTAILLRGNIDADGYSSGYAALKEVREAIAYFRANSKKPVHAYLVNPGTKDYYLASAASVVTLDPFGALVVPGLSAEEMFLAGFFEKYGIGMQVSRVGRFKSAVEPYTRSDMSPESRLQTASYLGGIWSEVKRGIAASRGVDTVQFQALVDSLGIIQPEQAKAAHLVDRVAYFDEVLHDLEALSTDKTGSKDAPAKGAPAKPPVPKTPPEKVVSAKADSVPSVIAAPLAAIVPSLPQISLDDYAPIAMGRSFTSAKQSVAVVYAQGDIVDGQGSPTSIGGDAFARELRRIRTDKNVRAVVMRVNSPGGSAIASETIQRELALIKKDKPVVVSMGTVAASGGYWITTAASRIFAEPNTITGSIGVFSLVPNLKGLANKNGITFDTVNTGKYADLFTISRPRTPAEMAVLQRGVDAVYAAFIERVATARHLTPDSVRAIAEGRVWSGEDAMKIGLVDSIGGLDVAIKSAATLANIVGDYSVRELPHRQSTAEMISEFFEHKSPPVARLGLSEWAGRDPVRTMARDLMHEMEALLAFNDPRGMYARVPFVLRVK